jgi:hypothetical protein
MVEHDDPAVTCQIARCLPRCYRIAGRDERPARWWGFGVRRLWSVGATGGIFGVYGQVMTLKGSHRWRLYTHRAIAQLSASA